MKIEDKILEEIRHHLILYRGKEFTADQTAQHILSAISRYCVPKEKIIRYLDEHFGFDYSGIRTKEIQDM